MPIALGTILIYSYTHTFYIQGVRVQVIDTITADAVEIGDLISLDGEEIEILKFEESDDIDRVAFRGYSQLTGDTNTYALAYDCEVSLLGY
jgi:hypothetical protein